MFVAPFSYCPFTICAEPPVVFKSEIDANVMQHTIFLNSYNERQQTDLVGIVHVPTPPMGLYSKKHPPGTPIKPGSTVEIIQDGKSLGKQAITGDSFSSTVKGLSGYAYAKVYDANKDKPDLYLITSAAQLK